MKLRKTVFAVYILHSNSILNLFDVEIVVTAEKVEALTRVTDNNDFIISTEIASSPWMILVGYFNSYRRVNELRIISWLDVIFKA